MKQLLHIAHAIALGTWARGLRCRPRRQAAREADRGVAPAARPLAGRVRSEDSIDAAMGLAAGTRDAQPHGPHAMQDRERARRHAVGALYETLAVTSPSVPPRAKLEPVRRRCRRRSTTDQRTQMPELQRLAAAAVRTQPPDRSCVAGSRAQLTDGCIGRPFVGPRDRATPEGSSAALPRRPRELRTYGGGRGIGDDGRPRARSPR